MYPQNRSSFQTRRNSSIAPHMITRLHLTMLDDSSSLILQKYIKQAPSDSQILSILTENISTLPYTTLAESAALGEVFLALLLASVGNYASQRRRSEVLLNVLGTHLLSLAVTSEGSRLLSVVLSCIPSSKVLVAAVSANFRLLATHKCGVKVVVAAMSRANSQALGALEALIKEYFVLLLEDIHGRELIEYAVNKEKLSISNVHSQIPSYISILSKLDNANLAKLITDQRVADILVDLAIMAGESGFGQRGLVALKMANGVTASIGTRRFVAAVILGLNLFAAKTPLIEIN